MRKKKPGFRLLTWGLLGIFATAAIVFSGAFLHEFPRMFPDLTVAISERAIAFFERISVPIRMAKLSMSEPDKTLEMPVHNKTLAGVSDSWQAPRGNERVHEGVDIFAPRGTPIFSATKGFVRRIGFGTLGGNFVFVTGAGGRRYYYAHLSEVASGLRVNQEVGTGTLLGFVGNTGNAATTPPHLHFGMYQSRTAINPYPLLIDR